MAMSEERVEMCYIYPTQDFSVCTFQLNEKEQEQSESKDREEEWENQWQGDCWGGGSGSEKERERKKNTEFILRLYLYLVRPSFLPIKTLCLFSPSSVCLGLSFNILFWFHAFLCPFFFFPPLGGGYELTFIYCCAVFTKCTKRGSQCK